MVSSKGATSMPWRLSTIQSYLTFWPILRTDAVLEQRLQARRAPRAPESAPARSAAAEEIGLVAGAGRAARSRRGPARSPARSRQARPAWRRGRRLGVEGDATPGARLGDPCLEAVERQHGLVSVGVERLGRALGRALGDERRGRGEAAGLRPARRGVVRQAEVGERIDFVRGDGRRGGLTKERRGAALSARLVPADRLAAGQEARIGIDLRTRQARRTPRCAVRAY